LWVVIMNAFKERLLLAVFSMLEVWMDLRYENN